MLKNEINFLGVYGSDELSNLKILSYPVFVIVNLDKISDKGRHWICLRLGKTTVELFDSLGGNPKIWDFYPSDLINFLENFSRTHVITVSPVLQPFWSTFCGLYCIFFVRFRQKYDFCYLVNFFSSNLETNDYKLLYLLKNKV